MANSRLIDLVAVAEEHVADLLLRVRVAQRRARAARPAIFFSAPTSPDVCRVNCTDGRVGEPLALPADRGLDQAGEELADEAEDQHRDAR